MERGVLETVLKKCARDVAIKKVIEVTHEPALNKGENYMSDIIRVRARVVLGNGHVTKKSYIIKKQLETSAMNELIKKYDIFKTEAMLYTVILKEMEYLIEEFEDTEGVMWCQLYDYGPTFLLFEDLKANGFVLGDRMAGLGLEEGKYVLHNIGRFHAMAKILEVRGIFTRDMVKPCIATNDRVFIKGIIHSGMVMCSKAMKESWGSSWEKIADKINIPFESLFEKFKELGQVDETRFNVLNHGDVWPNNIMFKYDWKNKPVAFKIIDFQGCHYNSCCWDITLFLNYSMVPSVRRANMPDLIQCYHNSLTKTLDRFGYAGKRPTVIELLSELDRLSFWGYCCLCSEYPAVVTDLMEGYEIDQVMGNNGEGRGYCIDVYKDKRLIEKIGPDLVQFVEKFLS